MPRDHEVVIDELEPPGWGILWAATCRTCGWWGARHLYRDDAQVDRLLHLQEKDGYKTGEELLDEYNDTIGS